MTPNPFKTLLHSRKFWLAMLDVFGSVALHFVTKYASPSAAEDVKLLIITLQPVFLVIIGSIAYEDAAKVQAPKTVVTQTQGDSSIKSEPVQ